MTIKATQDVLPRFSRHFTNVRVCVRGISHNASPNFLDFGFGVVPTAEVVLHVVDVIILGCFDQLGVIGVVVPLLEVGLEYGLGTTDYDAAIGARNQVAEDARVALLTDDVRVANQRSDVAFGDSDVAANALAGYNILLVFWQQGLGVCVGSVDDLLSLGVAARCGDCPLAIGCGRDGVDWSICLYVDAAVFENAKEGHDELVGPYGACGVGGACFSVLDTTDLWSVSTSQGLNVSM